MLISLAHAQNAGGAAASTGGGLEAFLPLILIFVVFYFLLIRPQQKKMKEHKALLDALRRGDKVLVGGGIVGVVTKLFSDTEVQVEIAENVRVKVMKAAITEVLSKSEPVSGGKDEAKADESKAEEAKPESEEKASGLKALLGGKKE